MWFLTDKRCIWTFIDYHPTQLTFTCSKSTMLTLNKQLLSDLGIKKWHGNIFYLILHKEQTIWKCLRMNNLSRNLFWIFCCCLCCLLFRFHDNYINRKMPKLLQNSLFESLTSSLSVQVDNINIGGRYVLCSSAAVPNSSEM